jgi:hypothetical protein
MGDEVGNGNSIRPNLMTNAVGTSHSVRASTDDLLT